MRASWHELGVQGARQAYVSIRIDILLIRSWTEVIAPIVQSLHDAGFAPVIERVDHGSALSAALMRGPYDVAIYDPATPAVARDVVERGLRDLAPRVPLVILDSVETIGARVHDALAARRN